MQKTQLVAGQVGEEVKVKYPRTKRALEHAMKVVQRELEDGKLKVDLLSSLVDIMDKLGGNSGRRN